MNLDNRINHDTDTSTCRVCGTTVSRIFKGLLLHRLPVSYYECSFCGYVQTQDPYWLEDAYSQAITNSDTGIMVRNQYNAKLVLATLYVLGKLQDTVVDYAGGYGILVRLLRDIGINALWTDRYSKCLLAPGFEYISGSGQLVTAFEAFEHFVNPREELENLLSIAPNVLLSTEIIPSQTPALNNWWYYGLEHGQHIGFFRIKTLQYLASLHNKVLITDGHNYHLITDKKLASWHWQLARKIICKMPFLLNSHLSSKVWSDYLLNIDKSN